MPIYEYVCEKCGDQIEVMQKVTDKPLKRCRKCRGKLEKIVSRTAFQLKGSGWYKTDYAAKASSKGSDKADKSPEKKDKAESAPKESSSSESGGKSDA